jgi:hypothetical protein
VAVLPQVLLASAGGAWCVRTVLRGLRRRAWWTAASPGLAVRQARRLGPLLTVTWLVLATAALTVFEVTTAERAVGYTPDDAAAMDWLRQHGQPGEVLANDRFADAGIWAPYKAGMPILWPRALTTNDAEQRLLVLDNIDRLDQVPDARAAACALHVGYVYYGAKTSSWDTRGFPPVETLEASPALEVAFQQGGATIFRLHPPCPS